MLPVSDELLAALTSSQQVSCRADLLKGGQVIYSGLPVTGGSRNFTRASIVSHTLNLTLAPELDKEHYLAESTLTGGTVGVDGHEVRVYWQLHYVGGGSETVPLGRCRIDTMDGSLFDDAEVQITASSREAFVAEAPWVAPKTISGPSARSMIGSIIREVLGSADVMASTSRDARVPPTPVEGSRWDVIKSLADSIAATVRCDAYGRFVIADAPTVDTAPAWTAKGGEGGVIVSAGLALDRSRVRNAWVVQGSSPSSDSAPIQAVVYDDAVGSPTRWGDPDAGRFGMVSETVSFPNLTTLEQCRAVARARLAQTTGAASSVNLQSVPNPALEPGDVIDIITDPSRPAQTIRRHVIDSGSMDLTPGGAFTLQTRDLRQVGDA